MARIIMVADTHLGLSGRLSDIMWGFRVVAAYADREGIDVILGLGDLFDDRVSLDIDVLCSAHGFFRAERDRGRQWIWIPGNHDMFLKHSWEVNSLKPFGELLTIVDAVKLVKIDGSRFWTLPFIHFETSYMKVLRKIEERHEDGDVLLTHIGVMGAVKNICFLLKDWSIVNFCGSKFDRVYTGHFHIHQQVGDNVWYPGSIIPFKADEGDCQHGFLVYDTRTRRHDFVDIWQAGAELLPGETPPPNYLTIAETTLAEISDQDLKGLIRNNNVRVAITEEYGNKQKADIAERLKCLGSRTVRWLSIAPKEETTGQPAKPLPEELDLFEAWLRVDHANLQSLDVDMLRKINAEVVAAGDDRYRDDE